MVQKSLKDSSNLKKRNLWQLQQSQEVVSTKGNVILTS